MEIITIIIEMHIVLQVLVKKEIVFCFTFVNTEIEKERQKDRKTEGETNLMLYRLAKTIVA